jgi:multicomponent Na+:H+ antiporter subunit B
VIAVIDIILFGFLVVTAFAIIRLRDLFAAVMMASLFSLLAAALFMVMDAVDVAFTEASVGAGISTLLMLATLAITRREEKAGRKRVEPLPLLLAVAIGGILIYGTLDMPRYGDPQAPVHQHVAPRFLEQSPDEVGPPNIVTSVLASYRGYDTFGETTVVFTAVVGALLLLGGRRRDREAAYELTMGVDLREVQRIQAAREAREKRLSQPLPRVSESKGGGSKGGEGTVGLDGEGV